MRFSRADACDSLLHALQVGLSHACMRQCHACLLACHCRACLCRIRSCIHQYFYRKHACVRVCLGVSECLGTCVFGGACGMLPGAPHMFVLHSHIHIHTRTHAQFSRSRDKRWVYRGSRDACGGGVGASHSLDFLSSSDSQDFLFFHLSMSLYLCA